MIDPLTALTVANTAFQTVKRLVEHGREIEDVAGQLGKWFEAASDINFAKEQAENPSMIQSLFRAGSIEKQALDATIAREKLKEQEAELRSLITLRYSPQTYKDMMQLRKDIKARREQMIYKQRKRQQKMLDSAFILLGAGAAGGVIYAAYSVIQSARP